MKFGNVKPTPKKQCLLLAMRARQSRSPSMHMTTPDSSTSAAESSMDDASNHRRHHNNNNRRRPTLTKRTAVRDGDDEDVGDGEVWQSFNTNFQEVQSVLDRNRSLIQQVNENHQSRLPDNMAKNVALIQELNGNISKVVSLYSDLNTNFSSYYHDHQVSKNGKPDAPPQR